MTGGDQTTGDRPLGDPPGARASAALGGCESVGEVEPGEPVREARPAGALGGCETRGEVEPGEPVRVARPAGALGGCESGRGRDASEGGDDAGEPGSCCADAPGADGCSSEGSSGCMSPEIVRAMARTAVGAPAALATGAAGKRFGRYRLLEPLAWGGSGTVWKAWDTQLDGMIALRQISREDAGGSEALARLGHAARMAANLRHPRVVPVLEVGESGGVFYVTMELVAERTLAQVLEASRAAVPGSAARAGEASFRDRIADLVRLLAEVADVVAYAHGEGVPHLGLEPAVVLMDAAGRPTVTGFGLAREGAVAIAAASDGAASVAAAQSRAATTPGASEGEARRGASEYSSPEQAHGEAERIGAAGDVWSLGAILYEILTGRSAVSDAGDPRAVLRAGAENDPVPPRGLDPRIPGELDTACRKALDRLPERRPTAGEFAAALRCGLARIIHEAASADS